MDKTPSDKGFGSTTRKGNVLRGEIAIRENVGRTIKLECSHGEKLLRESEFLRRFAWNQIVDIEDVKTILPSFIGVFILRLANT